MTLSEIASIAASSPGWIAAILLIASGLIEISPIKINPWKAIGKAIGKAINGDVVQELESVKKAQTDIAHRLDERERIEDDRNADRQRERILKFNVELIRNLKHTKEDFNEIMVVMDEYEAYCENHKSTYKNNRADLAMENIRRVYREREEKNDFL
ncbi:MAG: hypothetical protein LIP12_17805 [Clostridiales bacterium]|nr:hypothetical protein [Clostridiales bacterium]